MKQTLLLTFFICSTFIYSQVQPPYNPSPIQSETDVSLSGIITFAGGPNINAPTDATYRVYLDTNSNPTTIYSDVVLTNVEYLFGVDVSLYYTLLQENTNYYWKVEVLSTTGDVLATSPIWTFLTKTIPIGNGGTFNGDVQLETQEEVDAFATNLYTSITGNLVIGAGQTEQYNAVNNFSTTDLTSLINLTSIGGDLKVYRNNALTTLEGLNNITSVGGKLDLFFQPSLINIDGLSSVMSVGGELKIFNLDIVTDLIGLSNLNYVGFNVYINNSNSLLSLEGLNSIPSINGLLTIYNNINLTNFCAITTTVNGNYQVYENAYNPTLQDLIDGDCSDPSLGIDDVSTTTFVVYPNPTTGRIIVKTESNNVITSLQLFSLQGQFIKKSTANEIDVSELVTGVYLLKIQSDRGVINKRVLKQ